MSNGALRSLITAGGDWRVPGDLTGEEATANGVVVIAGRGERQTLIADCRNDHLPRFEQEANARICARAPRLERAMALIERELGDMPASPTARAVYEVVLRAMKGAGVEVEPEE